MLEIEDIFLTLYFQKYIVADIEYFYNEEIKAICSWKKEENRKLEVYIVCKIDT